MVELILGYALSLKTTYLLAILNVLLMPYYSATVSFRLAAFGLLVYCLKYNWLCVFSRYSKEIKATKLNNLNFIIILDQRMHLSRQRRFSISNYLGSHSTTTWTKCCPILTTYPPLSEKLWSYHMPSVDFLVNTYLLYLFLSTQIFNDPLPKRRDY